MARHRSGAAAADAVASSPAAARVAAPASPPTVDQPPAPLRNLKPSMAVVCVCVCVSVTAG